MENLQIIEQMISELEDHLQKSLLAKILKSSALNELLSEEMDVLVLNIKNKILSLDPAHKNFNERIITALQKIADEIIKIPSKAERYKIKI